MRELTHFEISNIAGGIHNLNSGLGFIDTNFLQQAFNKAKKDGYVLGGIGGALVGAGAYGFATNYTTDAVMLGTTALVTALASAPYFYLIGFSTSKVWTNPLA